MVYIGSGNTGSVLAYKMSKKAILFSTATQDTNNFPEAKNIFTMSEDGASKRFKKGEEIWLNNEERLSDILSTVKDEKVIVFSSLGGGSGSSSLQFIAKILGDLNVKSLIVGILPYRKEINPPLANAVQSINSLIPFINKVSIMLFDNQTLIKKFDNNWVDINNHIINKVDRLIYMLDKYSVNEYSPLTLDNSELESVIYGGGFIDLSTSFIEEEQLKFEYSSLDKKTKNCLVGMFVDKKVKREKVDEYHNKLTSIVNKISSKASNSRMIPGIIRGNLENGKDRAYITIASGLSIDSYMKKIEKLRDEAIKKAMAFSEIEKTEKLIAGREIKTLDI